MPIFEIHPGKKFIVCNQTKARTLFDLSNMPIQTETSRADRDEDSLALKITAFDSLVRRDSQLFSSIISDIRR